MRREDIQTRILAKGGDLDARLKLGEAYLSGTAGIARNIPSGLGYLRSALAQAPRQAASCIARHLQLQDILQFQQLSVLELAAENDDVARIKLACWRLVRAEREDALELLRRCGGLAAQLLQSWGTQSTLQHAGAMLQALRPLQPMNLGEVVVHEAGAALQAGRLVQALAILESLADTQDVVPTAAHELVVAAVRRAKEGGVALGGLPVGLIEAALDTCANAGHPYAAFTLGRALAGLRCGALPFERLVAGTQLRKAAALLLRAADGGLAPAWLDLYRICSDYRNSVSNLLMARFCLEKAAQLGLAEAERRLGALELREATQIQAMERAVALLFNAARKDDALARTMLQSLVLPVGGSEDAAQSALREVHRAAPLLAMRLRLARSFGLTKLEALSVNPASGRRPWGLVVGKNPFVVKMRLSEPRAIPAVSAHALQCLEQAAVMFGTGDAAVVEGSPRARSLQQRRLFERLGLHDELFFSSATSQQRDVIRVGTKWAQRQRETLQLALAD